MTGSSILLDSSAWLNYFYDHKETKSIIEKEQVILTSSLSLFEIKRKLMRDKISKKKVNKVLTIIKSRSILVEITADLLERAADSSLDHRLTAMDAIIYTCAQTNDAILITSDADFKDLPKVKMT